jgi:hypothetical protein
MKRNTHGQFANRCAEAPTRSCLPVIFGYTCVPRYDRIGLSLRTIRAEGWRHGR